MSSVSSAATTYCLHTSSLPYSRLSTPVFLIRWVPWLTTTIKLSVKARWLVANLGKLPGSQRNLLVTLAVDPQKDERRWNCFWMTASTHATLPASSSFLLLCQSLFQYYLFIFPVKLTLPTCFMFRVSSHQIWVGLLPINYIYMICSNHGSQIKKRNVP